MSDEEIPVSEERKVPLFLYITYVLLIVGGLAAFWAYWNGSHGWLDRGFWKPLQQAAETTYPYKPKEPYLEPGQ
ncbi:hypothetical protein ACFLR2_00935 [Chlamydiota bacterium]